MPSAHDAAAIALCLLTATACPGQTWSGNQCDGIPDAMRIDMPTRMVAGKTLTLKAALIDCAGAIDWRVWSAFGTVTARRVSNGASLPTSTVVFDTHDGTPPADSIRFYNGVGTVSLTLDNGAIESAGDIDITVSLGTVSATRRVTVLSNPTYRNLSGTLGGADLTWRRSDGVVRITGNCTVLAGNVLTIEAGTLIMVNAGAAGAGTLVSVFGRVDAQGTEEEPVFFFPSNGASALRLTTDCATEQVWNTDAWQGILHSGVATSNYRHVFISGAGNAPRTSHARPPILSFRSGHSFVVSNCVFSDNNGKGIYTVGSGPVDASYTLTDSVFSRGGHGCEFNGMGMYSLLVERCWFQGLGHAPESCNWDGDCMNIRGQDPQYGGLKLVRDSFFGDGGDDGIDQRASNFTVENCVIYDVDGNVGITCEDGGTVTCDNLLVFDMFAGLSGGWTLMNVSDSTFDCYHPVNNCRPVNIQRCVLQGNGQTTCCGGTYTDNLLSTGSNVSCGTSNVAADPRFVNAAIRDYDLATNSPARTAGVGGVRIGWVGRVSTAPTSDRIALTFKDSATIPGLGTVSNEDVVVLDRASGEWSMLVDGSDLGLGAQTIDALAFTADGGIVLSFQNDSGVPGLINGPDGTLVDDADLVLFTPTTLGATTSGTLSMYLDASDIGLDSDNAAEDIDAVSIRADGSLLVSTLGSTNVLGPSAMDEDILVFTPTALGPVTAGTWSLYVDGSMVGLSTSDEDVDAVGAENSGALLMSTFGVFSTSSVSGSASDIIEFTPTSTGTATSGTISLQVSLAAIGIDATENLNAVEIVNASVGSAASVALPGGGGVKEPCDADLNRDGLADATDLADFLGRYFDGDADFDRSGYTDPEDVSAYLNELQSGCR